VGATDLAQGDVVASNGVAHVLNSIKPVDYLFQRSVTVSAQDINLLKLDKAVFPASVVSRQIVKAGVYTTTGVFQFSLYGAGRSVTVDLCEYLPKSATPLDWRGIPAGYYNVYLNFFSDATCCSFDVAYNGKNINSSVIYGATYRPTVRQNLLLGTIYVTALGKVTLKFIDNARSTAHNLYIDNIRLEPVIAP
jgi:hypothetical protein